MTPYLTSKAEITGTLNLACENVGWCLVFFLTGFELMASS